MKVPTYVHTESDVIPSSRISVKVPDVTSAVYKAEKSGAGHIASGANKLAAGIAILGENRDKAAAAAAVNQFMDWNNRYLRDPEEGKLTLKGKNVEGLTGIADTDYSQKLEEIASSLKGPRQQEIFRNETAPTVRQGMASIMNHEFTATRDAKINELKANNQLWQDRIGDINTDDLTFNQGLDIIMRNNEEILEGQDKSVIQAANEQALSDAHTARVTGWIAKDQFGTARKYLERNGKEINTQSRNRLEATLTQQEKIQAERRRIEAARAQIIAERNAEKARLELEDKKATTLAIEWLGKYGSNIDAASAGVFTEDFMRGDKNSRNATIKAFNNYQTLARAKQASDRAFKAQEVSDLYESIEELKRDGRRGLALDLINSSKALTEAERKVMAADIEERPALAVSRGDVYDRVSALTDNFNNGYELMQECPTKGEFLQRYGSGLSDAMRRRCLTFYTEADSERNASQHNALVKALSQVPTKDINNIVAGYDEAQRLAFLDLYTSSVTGLSEQLGRSLNTEEHNNVIGNLISYMDQRNAASKGFATNQWDLTGRHYVSPAEMVNILKDNGIKYRITSDGRWAIDLTGISDNTIKHIKDLYGVDLDSLATAEPPATVEEDNLRSGT